MALEYTEEKLNSLDKETIIQLFLSQQEQLKQIDQTLQLVLEQVEDLKRHRFGKSSERHETEAQISFMEVDGKIVFFNEAEAVAIVSAYALIPMAKTVPAMVLRPYMPWLPMFHFLKGCIKKGRYKQS